MLPLPIILSTLVLSSFATPVARDGPQVTLRYGTFRGVSNQLTGTDTFYGLPFAAPPVGPFRLREPQPFGTNFGAVIQDATVQKSDCPQQNAVGLELPAALANLTSAFTSSSEGSEDCLYVNVFRPSNVTSSSKLPVLYFIYGSAFAVGGISGFDGTNIVTQSMAMSQDVIFVTANYRLSAWGWMPGQEIQEAGLGNIGLLDQRAALEWVQRNIVQFGGDPGKVTIMGESAGAISVALQMTMNGGKSDGLFRAGIMESGSVFSFGPLSNGQAIFDQIVTSVNCTGASDKLDCLRSVDAQTFYNAVQATPDMSTAYRGPAASYIPRIDGKTLTDLPQNLFKEGKFAKVPIIIGENQDEGSIWQFTTLNVTTDAGFTQYLTDFFHKLTPAGQEAIIQQYPEDPAAGCPYGTGDLYAFTPESKRIASLLGDAIFIAPRRFVSQLYAASSLPVWSYHFTHTSPTPYLGAYHGSEVAYVFGETAEPLSVQMRAMWISFANSLDPNAYGNYLQNAGLETSYWPQYGKDGEQLEFGVLDNAVVLDDYRVAGMAIFNDNPAEFIV